LSDSYAACSAGDDCYLVLDFYVLALFKAEAAGCVRRFLDMFASLHFSTRTVSLKDGIADLNVFGNHGLQVAAGQLAVKLGAKELGSPSRHGAVQLIAVCDVENGLVEACALIQYRCRTSSG